MTASRKTPRNARPLSGSFIARIRDVLNGLSATERRLANFVLDFPGELASYSASELAKLAQVSNATVSRLIRRLGYKSFDEARRAARAEKRTGSPLFLSSAEPAGLLNSIQAHLQCGTANMNGTFNRLSESQINDIAGAITGARQVWVAGYRSSLSFATYFRWQASQVIERINVIPGAGETLAEHFVNISNRDCVVIFALRRRVPQIARIADYAAKAGAKILYVTDHQFTDPVQANWLIRCDTTAPGPLDNHVAVMALCGLLLTKIFELAGTAGRRRLSAIEAAHDAAKDL
jgi:DNA-binding MurR/RpiR family transcriptional regulator